MKQYLADTSLWGLVISNVISIILAVSMDWSMGDILWVYWAQSIIIGVINVFRMLSLKEFSTKNVKSNGKRPPETLGTKRYMAGFFAVHYGFFHLAYFIFLWQMHPLTNIALDQIFFIMMLVVSFLGSHGFSYRHNKSTDFKHKKPNIGTLLFYPYLRIIPMHIIIIVGGVFGSSTFTIIAFMLMKTFADAGMHIIEHKMFRKKV